MVEQEHIGSVAMGDSTPEWRYEIKHGPDGEANYAWLYRGEEMIATMRTRHAVAIGAALSRPVQEPVAWQPRYKQAVVDHHRSQGADFWEYAMSVYPTKAAAENYGHGGHEVRPLYAAPQPAHGTSATERVPEDQRPDEIRAERDALIAAGLKCCDGIPNPNLRPFDLALSFIDSTNTARKGADMLWQLYKAELDAIKSAPAPNAVTAGQGVEAITDEMVDHAAAAYWLQVYGRHRKSQKWPDDVYGGSEELFRSGCRAALIAALATPTPKEESK